MFRLITSKTYMSKASQEATNQLSISQRQSIRCMAAGDIKRAGGAFDRKELAQEEQYFRKKEAEEIEKYRQFLQQQRDKAKNKSTGTTDANKQSTDDKKSH